MKFTPSWMTVQGLLLAGLIAGAGCAQPKKPSEPAANSTEPVAVVAEEAVVVEETVPVEDMPVEEAPAETTDAPPTPEEPAPVPAEPEQPAEPAPAPEEPAAPAEEKPAAEEAAAEAAESGKVVLGSDELFTGIPGDGEKVTIEADQGLARRSQES